MTYRQSGTRKAATLNDIAREVGVSTATVSLVLNGGRSTSRVSQSTSERIHSVARALGYQPNAIARSLVERRTNIIGIYVGYGLLSTHNPFFADVVTGLQVGCEKHHKDLLLHSPYRGRNIDEIYGQLVGGKVDGLILLAPPDDPLAARLAESALPVVAIADPIPALPSVTVDDEGGMRMIAEHLFGRGHRRIAFRLGQLRPPSALLRHAAFSEYLKARGVEVITTSAGGEQGELSEEEKELLLLPDGERPTAVACWNDEAAYALLYEIDCLGLSVPGDLAVTGFDGLICSLSPIFLSERIITTADARWAEVAETAVSLLVAMREGETIPQETRLPVRLITGNTT